MKSFLISVCLLLCVGTPVLAQTASPSASPTATDSGEVRGLYDDEDATASASVSATPTPMPRTTTLNTANTPVSGAVENTIALLLGGITLLIIGYRFSQSPY